MDPQLRDKLGAMATAAVALGEALKVETGSALSLYSLMAERLEAVERRLTILEHAGDP